MRESFLKSLPKVALGSASLLLALYFVLAPRVAKRLYAKLLFHPHPYPQGDYESGEIGGISYEDVFFAAADGTILHAWYFEQPAADFTVLMSHGNTGNLSERKALIESILKTGVSLFVYDYRGFGRSKGRPSVAGVIEDACAAFDYLVEERACASQRIVLYGESLGAAVSCQLTLRRPTRGLILQSAFSSLTKISKQHIPLMHIYPESLFPHPLLDNVAVLRRRHHPPVLVLHGNKDPLIPFSHAQELLDNAVNRKFMAAFPEAEHSDIPLLAQDRFVSVMKDFLNQLG